MRVGRGKVAVKNRDGIEAVGISDPACAARGYAGQAPADVVAAAQFSLLRDEKAEECAADVAEAYDGQVIRWDGSAPSRSTMQNNTGGVDLEVVGAQYAAPLQANSLMRGGG